MMDLLYPFSWFLLAVGIILFTTMGLAVIMKKKNPEVTQVMSKLSVFLSYAAIFAVVYTTVYNSITLMNSNYEETCAFFGLQKNTNTIDCNMKVAREVKEEAASIYFWAITSNNILMNLLVVYISICLCISAIMSLYYFFKTRDGGRVGGQTDISKDAMNNHLEKGTLHDSLSRGNYSEEKKNVFVCPKMSGVASVKAVPLHPVIKTDDKTYRWLLAKALLLFTAAIAGGLILNNYYDATRESLMNANCMTNITPQPLSSSDGLHLNHTEGKITPPITIVSREEWMAKPPKDCSPLKNPVKYVIINYTPEGSCITNEECIAAVQAIQAASMDPEDGMCDISSNFLVAGDGRVYMGRGWATKADDTGNIADDSITVLIMGTHDNDVSQKNQMEASKKLIVEGIRTGKIVKEVELCLGRKSKRCEVKNLIN